MRGGYFFSRVPRVGKGGDAEIPNLGRNLNAWASALSGAPRSVGSSQTMSLAGLREKLAIDRRQGFLNLDRARIPRYSSIEVDLPAFLQDPKQYFDMIGTEKFFFSAIPDSADLPRRASKPSSTAKVEQRTQPALL